MKRLLSRASLFSFAVLVCASLSAQEAQPDGPPTAPTDPPVDPCISARTITDLVVLSDEHVYVQTRGRNQYLMTTEHCENLQRSFRGNVSVFSTRQLASQGPGATRLPPQNTQTIVFLPHGDNVCQADGSHFIYRSGGREAYCPVLKIQHVESREEARAFASDDPAIVEIEPIPLPDDD